MGTAMGDFVVFDNDETSNEGEDRGAIEDCVNVCTVTLLIRGVRRLQYKNRLSGKKDSGRIQKLQKS